MKILYSVQATGNGHISRAKELIPYLQEFAEVDVFLSGDNSQLETSDLPVKFRSKGLSFYYNSKGGLDYIKTIRKFNPLRIWMDAKSLPVQDYDIVLNDFDGITSLACRLKNVGSLGVGHQPSFLSNKVPKPKKKSFIGEFILRNLAKSTLYMGFHFKCYDNFIFQPIIKKSILNVNTSDSGDIIVYLPQYSDEVLIKEFSKCFSIKFKIFSKSVTFPTRAKENVYLIPINQKIGGLDISYFDHNLISCHGIITGGGFETPAEALYLGKKLMVIPIKGQYEQECNAVALQEMGVKCLKDIDSERFSLEVTKWYMYGRALPKLELYYTMHGVAFDIIASGLRARDIN